MNRNQRVRKNCARMIEQAVKRISQGKPIEAQRLLDAAKQWMDEDYVVYTDPRIRQAYSEATAQLKISQLLPQQGTRINADSDLERCLWLS